MSDIQHEQWQTFSKSQRESFARRLADELPTGFQFQGLATHRLGSQEHEVATFNGSGATFVLVPGGTFQIGYNADRPWQPNPDELESWNNTAEEYEIESSIQEHIANVTLRRRIVQLEPLLIEVAATEVGWQLVALDDPTVQHIIENCFAAGTQEYSWTPAGTKVTTRVRRAANGSFFAWRADNPTHTVLSQELSRSGFRFPTSDEWEYACGAGAETLFRWGDHVPGDHSPSDQDFEWNYHRLPNAFGLTIAQDPYQNELVAEPDVTRGGDGGVSECGAYGNFVCWLPLASAYFDADICQRDPDERIAVGYTFGRRVLPLS
jgi:hypothetical protein